MKFLVFLTFAAASLSAFAGSSSVEIRCKSATGKTVIEAFVPGDGDDASVKFTVDGKTKTWLNGTLKTDLELNDMDLETRYPGYELAAIAAIDQVALKVLAIQVIEKTKYDSPIFTLVGRPSTIAVRSDRDGNRKGTFKASVTGVDPRDPPHGYIDDPIAVSCTYHYSN